MLSHAIRSLTEILSENVAWSCLDGGADLRGEALIDVQLKQANAMSEVYPYPLHSSVVEHL
jgi:hypothetical protein